MLTINQLNINETEYDIEAKSYSGILPLINGGTGASSAAQALANLGAAANNAVMPYYYYTSTLDFNSANAARQGIHVIGTTNLNSPMTSNHGLLITIYDLGTPFQLFFPDNQAFFYKRWNTKTEVQTANGFTAKRWYKFSTSTFEYVWPEYNKSNMLIWLKGNSWKDDSPAARSVTNSGGASLTTATVNGQAVTVINFSGGVGLTLGSSAIDFTNNTATFWIKTTSNMTWATVFSIGYTNGAGHTYEFRSNYSSTGKAGTTGRSSNSSTSIDKQSDYTWVNNEWAFFAIVKEGTNIKYYKNGNLIWNNTLAYGLGNVTPPNWYIGSCQFNRSAEWLVGQLADFRMYNYALTQSEIQTIYSFL